MMAHALDRVSWLVIVTALFAAAPARGQGPNAFNIDCPDPTVIAAPNGGGYYIFSTGDGVRIWHAKELTGFRRVGRVFEADVPQWAVEAVPGTDTIWAPDISFFRGKYHLYYAVSTFGSQRSVIGLAVNRTLDPASPDYRWEDRGEVIDSSAETSDFNAIDPALFVDRGGETYLFWGSFWTGLKATRIDAATGKPARQPPEIVTGGGASAGHRSAGDRGALLSRHDGWYYLFVSWDACCDGLESTYKVMVGRAPGARAVRRCGGAADDRGRRHAGSRERRALRGPGHNSVLSTPKGDWIVHHTYDARQPHAGRVLQIRPMTWHDGWPKVGEPLEAARAEKAP